MADVKALAITMVVLRVICLLALAASIAVFTTDQFTNIQGVTTTFKDIVTYRYVLSTAIIGAAYAMIQMPFAVYYSCTKKRMIRHEFLQELDFYGDKIISFLLASGTGAGFAYSFELKRMLDRLPVIISALNVGFPENEKNKFFDFLDRAIVATGLVALGFVCMAIVSICSSIIRSSGRQHYWR